MSPLRIPNLGWIIVGDSRRALFLRNGGTAVAPQLFVINSQDAGPNRRSAEQGSDRPGRVVNAVDGRKSSVEAPDYHDAREVAFAEETADRIVELCKDRKAKWIALVAAPRTLAVWRQRLHGRDLPQVKAEVAKDLTKHSVADLTQVLTGSRQTGATVS
jgi:protein required for attachment to host cells